MSNQQELQFVELVKKSGVALYGLLAEHTQAGVTLIYMENNDTKKGRSVWIPIANVDQISNMEINEAPWNQIPPGINLKELKKMLTVIRKNMTVDASGNPKLVIDAWDFIESTLEAVNED
ncbi:MAG: hypothetical protein V3R67_03510 [Thermodesulfobacteriota bacterium]